MNSRHVVVSGPFENLQGREVRFLEEAAYLGPLTVLLWSDELIHRLGARGPKFPEAERRYCLEAIRFVDAVRIVHDLPSPNALPEDAGLRPDIWAVTQTEDNRAKKAHCSANGIECRVFADDLLTHFPDVHEAISTPATGRKKVVVTGCYDWFHSGHVRFCEEAAAYGELFVVVGSDANVKLLKGDGHPLFSQQQRRYVAASIRFVSQALVSTGEGWLDADPEIRRVKPDIFAVNEDGDKGGKREYCAKLGIEYLVLKRTPAPGLPRRTSTDLRGF